VSEWVSGWEEGGREGGSGGGTNESCCVTYCHAVQVHVI
jgi:hypothetical protein